MEDNDDILRTGDSRTMRLSGETLILMLKGAGYAAVFCLVIWFAIAALYQIGKLLPEDSRFTPDPTPYSFNLTAPELVQLS